MDISLLSKKKQNELRKNKEDERKADYDKFVGELDELYFDLYSTDYDNFYEYFISLMDNKYYCVDGRNVVNYKDFRDFVDKNSWHRDEFKDKKIGEYLDDESSEEEEEVYNLDNDFFIRKGERF